MANSAFLSFSFSPAKAAHAVIVTIFDSYFIPKLWGISGKSLIPVAAKATLAEAPASWLYLRILDASDAVALRQRDPRGLSAKNLPKDKLQLQGRNETSPA
jgi:hypothetical protein